MITRRTITRGIGALDPSAWASIVKAVDYVENKKQNTAEPTDTSFHNRCITVKITGATQTVGVGKWTYAWTQARRITTLLTPTSHWYADEEPAPALNDLTSGMSQAVNLLEQGNTAAQFYGTVVSSGTDIPNTEFKYGPVPNGACVELTFSRAKTGKICLHFSAPNPILGSC